MNVTSKNIVQIKEYGIGAQILKNNQSIKKGSSENSILLTDLISN